MTVKSVRLTPEQVAELKRQGKWPLKVGDKVPPVTPKEKP